MADPFCNYVALQGPYLSKHRTLDKIQHIAAWRSRQNFFIFLFFPKSVTMCLSCLLPSSLLLFVQHSAQWCYLTWHLSYSMGEIKDRKIRDTCISPLLNAWVFRVTELCHFQLYEQNLSNLIVSRVLHGNSTVHKLWCSTLPEITGCLFNLQVFTEMNMFRNPNTEVSAFRYPDYKFLFIMQH